MKNIPWWLWIIGGFILFSYGISGGGGSLVPQAQYAMMKDGTQAFRFPTQSGPMQNIFLAVDGTGRQYDLQGNRLLPAQMVH
jgi:hypothetical protein